MTHQRLILVFCCLHLLLLYQSGCAPESGQRFAPTATNARQAVENALSTWKSGAKHETITSSIVKIDVLDSRWRNGKKLESYMITEEIKGQPLPQFTVRLKLEGKPEETETYLVVGKDPLQVFSEVEYSLAMGVKRKGK